jgi:hypothetical protein
MYNFFNIKIPVFCFTNLDDYRGERWPNYFISPPQKGDYVFSKSGKKLKIVSINHKMDRDDESYLEIELWK